MHALIDIRDRKFHRIDILLQGNFPELTILILGLSARVQFAWQFLFAQPLRFVINDLFVNAQKSTLVMVDDGIVELTK